MISYTVGWISFKFSIIYNFFCEGEFMCKSSVLLVHPFSITTNIPKICTLYYSIKLVHWSVWPGFAWFCCDLGTVWCSLASIWLSLARFYSVWSRFGLVWPGLAWFHWELGTVRCSLALIWLSFARFGSILLWVGDSLMLFGPILAWFGPVWPSLAWFFEIWGQFVVVWP